MWQPIKQKWVSAVIILPSLTQLNAVTDVVATSDATWKQIINGVFPSLALPAVVAADAEELALVPNVEIGLRKRKKTSEHIFKAQTYKFTVETAEGQL